MRDSAHDSPPDESAPPQHPMRDLADRIMTLTREHDAYSQAYQIVNMACDHLRAVARTHEQQWSLQRQNDKITELKHEREMSGYER